MATELVPDYFVTGRNVVRVFFHAASNAHLSFDFAWGLTGGRVVVLGFAAVKNVSFFSHFYLLSASGARHY